MGSPLFSLSFFSFPALMPPYYYKADSLCSRRVINSVKKNRDRRINGSMNKTVYFIDTLSS